MCASASLHHWQRPLLSPKPCVSIHYSMDTPRSLPISVYVFTKTRLHIIALNDNWCFYMYYFYFEKSFRYQRMGILRQYCGVLCPLVAISMYYNWKWKQHRHKKILLKKKSCQAKADTQSMPFQLTRSGVERTVMSHIEAISNRDCYRDSATLRKVMDQDLEVLI